MRLRFKNADPIYFLNIIKENEQEGIILRGESESRCDVKIVSNGIFNNQIGGALC